MRAVVESSASLAAEVEGANNVLVLAPSMASQDGEACTNLLSVAAHDEEAVVSVTFNESPDARIEAWRANGGPDDPAKLGFVVVGDEMRSAAASQPVAGGPSIDGVGPTIVSVSSPGDLTGIGIKLGNFLEDWADDDHRLVLCFHTLTTFLQYADLRPVFRFLHVLTGRVAAADGVAHYHLDPSAHDEKTVNTLLALYDAVVELDGDDGRWQVRRRR